jgi:hypothetical protein
MLHEVLAVEQSKKSAAAKVTNEAISQFKEHRDRYEGMVRTYTPNTEDGERLPAEEKHLGDRVHSKLEYVFGIVGQYVDVAVAKETANCQASADIIIDGKELIKTVPATALLFLERELKELRGLLDKIPTLDPSARWDWSPEQNCYESDDLEQARTKKTPFAFVKAEATQHHPAQVETMFEDKVVGTFAKKRFSGAASVYDKAETMQRVDKLLNAVVEARMRANQTIVTAPKVAAVIEKYLLDPLKK